MAIEHIIAFNIALVAAILSPGPAMLFMLQSTLAYGRRYGITIGVGLGLMASIWTCLALFGLGAVFTIFPEAYLVMKTAGALYLIYLAWVIWRSADRLVEPATTASGHAFLAGVLVNLLNPKSILFAASVLVVIFPNTLSVNEKLLISLNQFFVEIAFYTLGAVALSSPQVSKRYLKRKIYLDRLAALVLGFFGFRLLFEWI